MKHFHYSDFMKFIALSPDDEGAGGTTDTGTSEKSTETTQKQSTTETDEKTTGTDETDPLKALEAKLKAEFDALLANEVAGLKKKNEELLGKVQKAGKTALTEEEFNQYNLYKQKLENDRLLRMIHEGKSAEVIEEVTARTRAEYEAKLTLEAQERAKALEEAAAARREVEHTKVSVTFAREAAALVEPQYISIVEQITKNTIKLVEGEVRVVNDDGSLKRDASGNPIAVKDYLESLRATYPALFKSSSGGGAGGSTNNGTKRVVNAKMTAEEMASLSPMEYAKLRKEGKI